MEGGGGHGRIVETSQSLTSKFILTNAVKAELNKYDARREQLMEPVRWFLATFCEP